MKPLILISVILVLFSACNPSNSTSSFDEQKEIEAIKQVIESETKCFFGGDYECWADTWVHEKYSMQAWNNAEGSYDAVIGWKAIDKQGSYWIKEYYGDGSTVRYPSVKREKPIVKFFNENTAYLIWVQYNADAHHNYFQKSNESRILEKHDGKWKIVNVTAFWDNNTNIPMDSLTVEQAW